jgi:hypothetical protein
MKRSLLCFTLFAFAAPVAAQARWSVSGDYGRCAMASPARQISVVWEIGQPSLMRIHVRGEELNSVASSTPLNVDLQFEFATGEPNSWDDESSILENAQGSSTAILRVRDAAFLEALAAARYAILWVYHREVLNVPLAGSADATARFRQCVARVRAIDDRVKGRRTF